ncbi:MAG TPA: hypothetical protein VNA69_15670 [Thermoanaerobaculia bacterium]|nr:hypothetical protein [Thermoanaerobaculia bacterium]
MRFLLIGAVALIATLPSLAAPPRPYHLELEASPAAAFPYLGKFGNVELHVYAGGVRAEALWLNSFSRNGAPAVTVMNPLGRMYVDVPVNDIAPILTKLAGRAGSVEQSTSANMGPAMQGTVAGIAATRHRLVYGPTAWIDVWTTNVIPENPQLRRIVDELVRGISPGTARVSRTIRGTPIYVEINFRRFKKVPLLKLKKLSFAADDEEDALKIGPLYMRAPLLEKLFE